MPDVRELHLTEAPGTVVEHFRLDPEGGPSTATSRPEAPIGVARWVRGPLPGVEGGWRTACEVHFFQEETRVLHTERLSGELRELVFRELHDETGRTLYFSWTPDGRGASRETIGRDVRRSEFDMPASSALPLSLVELARRDEVVVPEVSLFQPLANEVAAVTASVSRQDGVRVLDLRRAEGLPVGRFEFDGPRLISFRWQSGGPVATAFSEEEYERWLAALGGGHETEPLVPVLDDDPANPMRGSR